MRWMLLSLLFSLSCCSYFNEESSETVRLPETESESKDSGTLELIIQAPDTLSRDSILEFEVRVVNRSIRNQTFLFDKPEPWDIIVKLKHAGSGESALEVENRRLLSSNIYPEDSLLKYYYLLAPGDSISRIFKITDIAALKHYDPILPPGNYKLELVWNGILSNKLLIIVPE